MATGCYDDKSASCAKPWRGQGQNGTTLQTAFEITASVSFLKFRV